MKTIMVPPAGAGADVPAAPVRYEDPDRIDIGRLVRILRRRRLVFSLVFLLVAVPLVALLFALPRLYTAQTTVMIDPRVEHIVDIKSVLSGLLGDPEAIASEVEVIRSRDVAREVVRALDLTANPEFNPELASSLLGTLTAQLRLGLVGASAFMRGQAAGLATALGFQPEGFASPAEHWALEQSSPEYVEGRALDLFAKRLTVVGLNKSRVLAINFTSRDPKLAAEIANRIANLYLKHQLSLSVDATKEASDWLGGRLAGLRAEVDRSEKAVERFRTESILRAGLAPDSLDKQSESLSERLVGARAEAAQLRARSTDAEQQLRRGGPQAVLALLNSEVATRLRAEETALTQQAAEFGEQLGPQHPRMRELDDKRKSIAAQISDEARRQLDALRAQLSSAEQQVTALEKEGGRLDGMRSRLTDAEVTLRSLEREAEANRSVLELFLKRYKETEQSDTTRPSAWIVSRADVPIRASKPNRLLLLAGALAFAGAGGATAAFYADRRRGSALVSVDDLRSHLGIETHAAVPLVRRKDARKAHAPQIGAYAELHPASTFGSAVRGLALELMVKLANDGRPNTVAITSALPAEGKTTISTAVAITLARADRRVLLIDGDLIRGQIHRVLNLPNESGLSEYLEDPLATVPLHRPFPDLPLQVATAGNAGLGGANTLRVERLLAFIQDASARYDVVIVDTPPTLPVPYSRIVASCAGHTVLIVSWGRTDRQVVRHAAARLASAEAHLSIAVLNRVNLDRQADFDCTEAHYVRDKAYRAYLES